MKELMDKMECPYCGKRQTRPPIKSWKYGTATEVSRYECICGKLFNHYKSPKKSWTIPKQK